MGGLWATRVCPGCNVVREREEFSCGKRKLSELCVRCLAKPKEAKPCLGCGEMHTKYRILKNGRIFRYCDDCQSRKHRSKVCKGCHLEKPYAQFHRYGQGSFSLTCEACRRPFLKRRVCIKCKEDLPVHAFHKYARSTLADSCHKCRIVRPRRTTKIHKAPAPCVYCKKEFSLQAAPSVVARRKTCSKDCQNKHSRVQSKLCLRCKRVLSAEAFARRPNKRGFKPTCLECEVQDADVIRGRSVPRPSIDQMAEGLRRRARGDRVPYMLSREQIEKLHNKACDLCGKPCSSVALRVPSKGFMFNNCRPVCRLCRKLLKLCSFDELFLLAHEIATHLPLCNKAS